MTDRFIPVEIGIAGDKTESLLVNFELVRYIRPTNGGACLYFDGEHSLVVQTSPDDIQKALRR